MRAGLLTSILSGALGGVVSIIGGAVLAIFRPAILDEWRHTGGIDEVFLVVPLIMVLAGVVMGLAGALAGKIAAWPLARLRTPA